MYVKLGRKVYVVRSPIDSVIYFQLQHITVTFLIDLHQENDTQSNHTKKKEKKLREIYNVK